IIPADAALAYAAKVVVGGDKPRAGGDPVFPPGPGPAPAGPVGVLPQPTAPTAANAAGIQWSGDVPPQKWMNFYTKVLSRFAGSAGLKLTVQVEVAPTAGVSKQSAEDTRNALRELGLSDRVEEK